MFLRVTIDIVAAVQLTCPLGLEGLIWLACFRSLMNLYTCVKFDPDRSSGLEAFPKLNLC